MNSDDPLVAGNVLIEMRYQLKINSSWPGTQGCNFPAAYLRQWGGHAGTDLVQANIKGPVF